MLCWEASISLPGKHPSRLKWQAKACKNLLLTPFLRQDPSPPAAPPALRHRRAAAWESCCSSAWEQGKEMLLLPWAPEEIRASLAAVRSHTKFPAHSPGSFHSSFLWKNRESPTWVTSSSCTRGCCRCLVQTRTDVPSCGARPCCSKGMTNSRTRVGFVLLQPSPAELQVPPIPHRQRARI